MTTITNPETNAAVASWLAALRGGAYHQGSAYLLQEPWVDAGPDLYCCLGVACELSGLGQWGQLPDDHPTTAYAYIVGDGGDGQLAGHAGGLPDAVRLELGIRTELGEFNITLPWLDAMHDRAPDLAYKIASRIGLGSAGDYDPDFDWPYTTNLASLNDDGGLTFAEIALVIESEPPGLFA